MAFFANPLVDLKASDMEDSETWLQLYRGGGAYRSGRWFWRAIDVHAQPCWRGIRIFFFYGPDIL